MQSPLPSFKIQRKEATNEIEVYSSHFRIGLKQVFGVRVTWLAQRQLLLHNLLPNLIMSL